MPQKLPLRCTLCAYWQMKPHGGNLGVGSEAYLERGPDVIEGLSKTTLQANNGKAQK